MSVESLLGKEQSERQRWEYRFLVRSRGLKIGMLGNQVSDWSEDITSKVKTLGEEGWELIAAVPRSSVIIGTGLGAGFTSDELWVFKRPK